MNTALTTFFPPELPTILLRLFLAFIAGAVMGLERERFMKGVNRQRGAGFRTYSLVCFGSCLFGLASIYGFSSSGVNNDPGRVAAQVVTGMGFLGAGAIIKLNGNVKGLTTAAGMWVASAIGLLFSAGMYITAIVAAFFAYLTLDFHRLFPHLFLFSNDAHDADDDVFSEDERRHKEEDRARHPDEDS
ncbi:MULTISPECIES: MgtC/SapB family protein [Brevibacillus]|jgi:putative Mg2+ transporter-C (MgtC) family protein|uniref:MgtC/SapB family protein n=1 Tax=Brevibacillus TaxID=55080 RepID=UPI00046B0597|nr:MgtC/SapB family protein [Brevibacillus borstelensis]MCC0566656.1 MgtC/SapB family protein [Brevibacillus borstelensis]MED1851212.1 MgtC/SapB family protein [Brevibacillus borstelensis]NOU54984.1 MgtC/SapB family protein [Brevibacillus borstelensis]